MAATQDQILDALNAIAPLQHAEPWDNVGLLIDSTRTGRISRLFLTIDLTAAVADEAIAKKAQMIVAYHPPIFEPMQRLTDPRLLRLIQSNIAVYSPHTALDAAPGGVNDWLAEGMGHGACDPIEHSIAQDGAAEDNYKVVVFVPAAQADALRNALAHAGAGRIGEYSQCSFNISGRGTFRGSDAANPTVGKRGRLETVDEIRLEMICPQSALADVTRAIHTHHPYEEPAFDLYALHAPPVPGIGQGRVLKLDKAIALATLVRRVKQHLGLARVRLARAARHRRAGAKVQRIAVCAGAGASVLRGVDADVYLTGEMRHHDLLDATERGRSVILCDHTNTERGYLPVFKRRLAKALGKGVRIDISKRDAEPLQIV